MHRWLLSHGWEVEIILLLVGVMVMWLYGMLHDKKVFEIMLVRFSFCTISLLFNCTKKLQSLFLCFLGHKARVGSLSWAHSPRWLLSSGSRDRSILNRDVRIASESISKFSSHKQEVYFFSHFYLFFDLLPLWLFCTKILFIPLWLI